MSSYIKLKAELKRAEKCLSKICDNESWREADEWLNSLKDENSPNYPQWLADEYFKGKKKRKKELK